MNRNILGRIKSILADFSNAENKVARFVIDNPEKVINMNAADLAIAAGVSAATVIRFCKSIDINSFIEFKVQLSSELSVDSQPEPYVDIFPDESIDQIKNKLLNNAISSMKSTVEQLNNEKITAVSQKIKEASVIYVFGAGASWLAAEDVFQKWSRVGKLVIAVPDTHLLTASLMSAPENALFIAISNSGQTLIVNNMVKLAQKKKMFIVSITQFGSNKLSSTADIALQTFKMDEAKMRSAATSSIHAQFTVIDILFFAYMTLDYEKNINMIKASRTLLK